MVRKITIKNNDLEITSKVEIVFEKIVTKFGNSAKADIPKKYIGKRALIVILDE